MWKYKNGIVENVSKVPEGAIGFVYIIHTEDGRSYIGRKSMFSKRKKKFGKRKLAAMTDKRLKTFEYVIKESDWLTYTGSNKLLNEYIAGGGKITKEILTYAFTKKQLTYYENKYLFSEGVIESDMYFNDNVMGKFYRKDLII